MTLIQKLGQFFKSSQSRDLYQSMLLAERNPHTYNVTSKMSKNPFAVNVIRNVNGRERIETFNLFTGGIVNRRYFAAETDSFIHSNGHGKFTIQKNSDGGIELITKKFKGFKDMLSYFRENLPFVTEKSNK